MLPRTAAPTLLLLGLALVAVGAYGRREWHTESEIATLGVIALMAVGFLSAIAGLYSVLREQRPGDDRAAARARALDRFAWRAAIPPLVAGGLMLGFFALTDRWHNLANPVQSQVALFAGIIGALLGMLANRITRWELVIIPAALLIALLLWGDRLPLDSKTTSRGEMVALLVIAILLVGIAINVPQVIRGRRRASEPS